MQFITKHQKTKKLSSQPLTQTMAAQSNMTNLTSRVNRNDADIRDIKDAILTLIDKVDNMDQKLTAHIQQNNNNWTQNTARWTQNSVDWNAANTNFANANIIFTGLVTNIRPKELHTNERPKKVFDMKDLFMYKTEVFEKNMRFTTEVFEI